MRQLFNFLLFILILFAALWAVNVFLKSKDINVLEKKKQKRIKIREYREQGALR